MEFWQLYDEQTGAPLPRPHPRSEPLPPGTFHKAVGVWIVDKENQFLLTLRSPEKKRNIPFAGKIPAAVCSGEKKVPWLLYGN